MLDAEANGLPSSISRSPSHTSTWPFNRKLASILIGAIGCLSVYVGLQTLFSDAQGRSSLRCSEPVAGLGTISQDAVVPLTHVFRIDNESNESVPVLNIVRSCGCLGTPDTISDIGARSSAEYPVTIQPPNEPGPFSKNVQIVFGTSPPTTVKLTLQGIVGASAALYVTPGKVQFGEVRQGAMATKTVKIARYEGSALTLASFTSPSNALQITATAGDSRSTYIDLIVSLSSSGLPIGDFASTIEVLTDNPIPHRLMIPVRAKLVEPASGLVASIVVDRLSPGVTHEKALREVGHLIPHVTSLWYEGPSTIEVQQSMDFEQITGPMVRISRSPDALGPRVVRGMLYVQLSGNDQTFRIPLTAYLPQ